MTFKKGQSGNPNGRPKRKTEDKYLDIFRNCVSEDDAKEIVIKAAKMAKMGDATARKFIFDYLLGQPIQRTEHTGADGGAIKIKVTLRDDA